jgi:hypothetical protein
MLQTRFVGRWGEEQIARLLPPSSLELQLQRARTRARSSPGLSLCHYSPECVEGEFCELRVDGFSEVRDEREAVASCSKVERVKAPTLAEVGGRRWTMSRLLRVGDKVINLDNIEYITRDESSVVRVHFVHRDLELWNEQGEAFRQWVLSNAGYCEGSGGGW